MKKHVIKVWDLPSSGTSIILIVLSTAFFIGGLAGCILAAKVNGSGIETLSDFLKNYLSMLNSDQTRKLDLISIIWDVFRWPIYIFIFSVTPIGLFGIPVLFLVRGFLLSFSIASFYCAMGYSGLSIALIIFCLSGIISIPVCFILGVQGFAVSGSVAGRLFGENRRQQIFRRTDLMKYVTCALALLLCSGIECYLIPALLSGMTNLL